MKLQNKKTGEIGTLLRCEWNDSTKSREIAVEVLNSARWYKSLAELNEEWEDYEEPEEYWCIDWTEIGGIYRNKYEDELDDFNKQIGNYFKTKEEAEKAVEKLKAWKRLKDKGFRFDGWNGTQIGSNISYISEIYYEGCSDDMDLLFGGEE